MHGLVRGPLGGLDGVEVADVVLVDERRLDLVERLLLEATVLHVKNAVGVALHVGVVCDHDTRGAPPLVDLQQQVHDLHGVLGVEVAGGLVQQQNLGVVRQRARDGHALLLAPG